MSEIVEIQTIPAFKKNVIVGYECDCCGNKSNGEDFPSSWNAFTCGSDVMGSDEHIVCSAKCFKSLLLKLNKRERGIGTFIEFSTESRTRDYYEEKSDGRISTDLIIELMKSK